MSAICAANEESDFNLLTKQFKTVGEISLNSLIGATADRVVTVAAADFFKAVNIAAETDIDFLGQVLGSTAAGTDIK